MPTFIVLLRGVNVGGANRVPMAELRQACQASGFTAVRTYLNSGNVVMVGLGKVAGVESKVEAMLVKEFEVAAPVVVRTAERWLAYAAGNPFPNVDAKLLQLGLSKAPPVSGCADAIARRGAAGEQVQVVDDAVWIHFPAGVGNSKLTPAFLDKAAGSPLTMRNGNTVRALAAMKPT